MNQQPLLVSESISRLTENTLPVGGSDIYGQHIHYQMFMTTVHTAANTVVRITEGVTIACRRACGKINQI